MSKSKLEEWKSSWEENNKKYNEAIQVQGHLMAQARVTELALKDHLPVLDQILQKSKTLLANKPKEEMKEDSK